MKKKSKIIEKKCVMCDELTNKSLCENCEEDLSEAGDTLNGLYGGELD